MAIWDKLNPAKWVADLADSVLDKVFGDKASDEQKMQFKLAMYEAAEASKDSFNEFVLAHTGSAKDMPRFIQIVRGLVRPLITFINFGALLWVLWQWVYGPQGVILDLPLKLIFSLNLLTLGFWFGDKALERSGLLQFLAMGKKKES
jgi:hypothetical protein